MEGQGTQGEVELWLWSWTENKAVTTKAPKST